RSLPRVPAPVGVFASGLTATLSRNLSRRAIIDCLKTSATVLNESLGGPTGRHRIGPAVRPGEDVGLRMSAEGAPHRSAGPSALHLMHNKIRALTGAAIIWRAFGPG